MKFFIKNINVNTDKNVKDTNMICISDLHYTKRMGIDFLNQLTEKIQQLNPTYICFIGDLLEDGNELEIIDWLNSISKICPVYLSYGNHDIEKFSIIQGEEIPRKQVKYFLENEIPNIENFHILNNYNTASDENFCFCGADYLHSDFNFYDYLNMALYLPSFENENFNVLLSHNPSIFDSIHYYHINDDAKKNLDLILSGHTHNGLTPHALNKLSKGNNGLYSRNEGFFPSLSRGIIDAENNKEFPTSHFLGIINPALKTLPDDRASFRTANKLLYPPAISLVRIKKK